MTVHQQRDQSEYNDRCERRLTLLVRLKHLFLHFFHFRREDDFGWCSRIDTVSLDGDDGVSSCFQEVVGVESDDTSLIRLSDIGETVQSDRRQYLSSRRVIRRGGESDGE